jgi:hypothetical protein
MGFYDVMLRGMVSRILLSDPSYRPLLEPLDARPDTTAAAWDAEALTLTVTVTAGKWSQGHHLNYLPKSGKGIFDTRLTARVEVPQGVPVEKLGEPQVTVRRGAEPLVLTRHHVRHEVWGGKRYLNVQAEMPPGSVGADTAATFVFPLR